MTIPQDIEKEIIPNYEEYVLQKAIGGFSCTYDIVHGSAERKKRQCSMDEIAILRTIRLHDTETEKQIATRLGKPEIEVKTIFSTLIEDGKLKRATFKGQDYWELAY